MSRRAQECARQEKNKVQEEKIEATQSHSRKLSRHQSGKLWPNYYILSNRTLFSAQKLGPRMIHQTVNLSFIILASTIPGAKTKHGVVIDAKPDLLATPQAQLDNSCRCVGKDRDSRVQGMSKFILSNTLQYLDGLIDS